MFMRMIRITQIEYFFALYSAFLLSACEGNLFLKSNPCPDGKIRVSGNCIVAGKPQENCIDPDLKGIPKSQKVTLCNGETTSGLGAEYTNCSQDLQKECITNSKFPAADLSLLTANDVSKGRTVLGIAGAKREIKLCKNYSELSYHDATSPPANVNNYGEWIAPTSINVGSNVITLPFDLGLYQNHALKMTTSGTMPAPLISGQTYYADIVTSTSIRLLHSSGGSVVDITSAGTGSHLLSQVGDGIAQSWDTLMDNVPGVDRFPANNPWPSDEFKCDQTNFKKVSTNEAPLKPSGVIPTNGSHAFTEIWEDQLTGLLFSNVLYRGSGSNTWPQMVDICKSINGQSAGDGWRIPSIKEMMQLYVNGVSNVTELNWGVNNYVSSSKWIVDTYILKLSMKYGTNFGGLGGYKATLQTSYLFCVR